ncbi:hypothetical protein NLJ89_g8792 [Agrocybe chaxingu]|uniref:Chromatin elongation factor SPT5 n=1 Tax=Agrocybe chaxingu TaxID=84603 RepID=A0A9W8JUM8_9AGAR|nr:hypothetical protein NLJ89_g8792 [Agrocybe chaxingu]
MNNCNALTSNPFLDLEALVDGQGEDEGDEDSLDALLDDDDVEEETGLPHSALAHIYNKETFEECDTWLGLVQRAKQRAQMLSAASGPPHEGDTLWEVRCMPGKEDVIVFQIMKRALHPTMPERLVLSAFSQPCFPGRVFVEAPSRENIRQLAQGITELNGDRVRPVPHENLVSTLKVRSSGSVAPQTWVRIGWSSRDQTFIKGDVALVTKVRPSASLDLWIVPRFHQANLASASLERPPQVLRPHRSSGSTSGFIFSPQGYLILENVDRTSCYAGPSHPSATELELFHECEVLHPNTYSTTFSLVERHLLQVHDRIKVKQGPFIGLTGRIVSIEDEAAQVFISSQDLLKTIYTRDICKDFQCGDSVFVESGKFKGTTGWIVRVSDYSVSIMNMETYVEIEVSVVLVQFHEEWEAHNLRNLASSARSPSETASAITNPNQKYVGKHVQVVGADTFKGSRGVIKDTSFNGYAFVRLDIFNHVQLEKIHLSHLRLCLDDGKHRLLDDPPTHNEGPPADSLPTQLTASTPFSAVDSVSQASPAWNPSSCTPGPPTYHGPADDITPPPEWLKDVKFHTHRVCLLERGMTSSRRLEFKGLSSNGITVRDGTVFRELQLEQVKPFIPTRKDEIVAFFGEGDLFGSLFKIKTYGAEHCIVRDYSAKSSRHEILYTLPTLFLVEVLPPSRSISVVYR